MDYSSNFFYVGIFLYLIFVTGIAFFMQDTKIGFWKGLFLGLLYTPVVSLFIYLIIPDNVQYEEEELKNYVNNEIEIRNSEKSIQ